MSRAASHWAQAGLPVVETVADQSAKSDAASDRQKGPDHRGSEWCRENHLCNLATLSVEWNLGEGYVQSREHQTTLPQNSRYTTALPYWTPDDSDNILINTSQRSNGWRVEAWLPRKVSASDRRIVLDWLRAYGAEIRRQHPYWLAMLGSAEHVYYLDIVRAHSPQSLVARGLQELQERSNGGSAYG